MEDDLFCRSKRGGTQAKRDDSSEEGFHFDVNMRFYEGLIDKTAFSGCARVSYYIETMVILFSQREVDEARAPRASMR